MKRKLRRIAISLLNGALGLGPYFVFAQAAKVPEKELTVDELYGIVVNVMNYFFSFALAIAVILIVIGGVTYMTAGGEEEKIATAKKRVIWGLVGALIIALAWGLIYMIAYLFDIELIIPT